MYNVYIIVLVLLKILQNYLLSRDIRMHPANFIEKVSPVIFQKHIGEIKKVFTKLLLLGLNLYEEEGWKL